MITIIIYLFIIFIIITLVSSTCNYIWENKFQKKWRQHKCNRNNHNWGDSFDMNISDKGNILNLMKSNLNSPLIQFFYDRFIKNEYLLKNHTCYWCGKTEGTWEYDFDKINIQENRDIKIDSILKEL